MKEFNLNRNRIINSSPDDLIGMVYNESSPRFLRSIAATRFEQEAWMDNEDRTEPFIRWPAINIEHKAWLAIVLGKVVAIETQRLTKNSKLVVVSIPRSASWYTEYFRSYDIFKNAEYPLISKDPSELDNNFTVVPVSSYVHNRKPDGSRGKQDIYIHAPEAYAGATVILTDDAIAEGTSFDTLGQALKELGAKYIIAVAPLAKGMQGGIEKLYNSSHIDKLITLITVTKVFGRGQPMEFTPGLPWETNGTFHQTLPKSEITEAY